MKAAKKFKWFPLVQAMGMVLISAWLVSCPGSQTPIRATAPAPLAEIPSALRIPGDLSINVDKTRSESGTGTLKFLVGPGGEFSEHIAFGPNLIFFANERLKGLLGPLSAIEIPVSASLTEMDTFLAIGTTVYSVHLSFLDIDLNGDGAKEGCVGHTAGLPLCMRLWVDNGTEVFRLFAARFDAFPTEENPGAGSLRGTDLSVSGPGGPFQVAADYDHVDPENKFTDSFFGFTDETDPENPTVPFSIRAFASQLGPDASSLKTANGNSIDQTAPDGPSFGKGLGRWFEGEENDLWIGSFETNETDPSAPENITNQCARISNGDGAEPIECQNAGLNIDGLSFLPFTGPSDLLFFDFPDTF